MANLEQRRNSFVSQAAHLPSYSAFVFLPFHTLLFLYSASFDMSLIVSEATLHIRVLRLVQNPKCSYSHYCPVQILQMTAKQIQNLDEIYPWTHHPIAPSTTQILVEIIPFANHASFVCPM